MNRINIICLRVRDMEESLAFYKRIGFTTYEMAENPPIVFFDNKGTKLELYPIQALAEDIDAENPPEVRQGGFAGFTLAINLKSPEEVDAFMAQVAACGGVIAKEPQKVFWGGYSGYFQDMDGYYWEVAYGPDWKFDEGDMLIIPGDTG
ncbi:VOC family protein [Eubacteriales bacterium OttesenSCG-928-M02]|nr:VOC family protein [Eubacteriales bacterium OttesenSCG-928-M02]